MRFRAVMNDPSYMRKFTEILQVLSNLAKTSVLRVCPDKIFFVIMESQQPQAWWELDPEQFFSEFTMHGVSDVYNEFYLEFATAMLADTLITLKKNRAPQTVKIKLTDKGGPCLRFEMEMPIISLVRTCSHDFPVGIIPRSQWSGIHEAEEHSYDVSIEMPYIREMHQWLECFKSLGQHCYLVANENGDFQAKLVHDLGTCVKQFTGLQVVHEDGDHRSHDLTRLYGVRVDRRKLVAFLALEHSFPPDRVLQCDISERKLVHLQLVRGDAVLHFFCRHVIEDVAVRGLKQRVADLENEVAVVSSAGHCTGIASVGVTTYSSTASETSL